MATKPSFFNKYKDQLQIIYGTLMLAGLYFGLSNKIELLVQKEAADKEMLQYQINELKEKSGTAKVVYEEPKYAVVPERIKFKVQ